MARNGEQGEEQSPPARTTSSSFRPQRRNDTLLIICRCFSVLTSLTAMLCIAVNVLSAIRSFKHPSGIFDGVFRCYAVIFAIFVVLAETEWGFVMKFWKVFEYWAGRGMLQIFVAVMTRAFPAYSAEQTNLVLLRNVASYLLLACGLVYVISAILCIGCLKRSRQQKEITKDQAIKSLQELEQRREELERLLMEDRV